MALCGPVKHYRYRANQQVGLERLWSEDWALLFLIHSSESIYWLWIANHVPVQYHPNVVVQCLSWRSVIATCECFKRPTRPNKCIGDTSMVLNALIKESNCGTVLWFICFTIAWLYSIVGAVLKNWSVKCCIMYVLFSFSAVDKHRL